VLGSYASTASNQFIASWGTTNGGIDDIYFGTGPNRNGSDGAGSNITFHGSGADGSNQAGGNVTIAGGKGTGNGTPGYVSFSTPTTLGSGSTLQTLSERARIQQDSLFLFGYGSGNITGTATQNAAFDATGKIIERAFAYAEMYIDDANPDTISITSGTPAEGTDWTAGELSNFTYSAGRLTYTGTETAKFLVNSSISFSFSTVSSVVECWVYKNGTEVTKSEMHRKIGTGGDVGNGGQTCILELATNDYIEVFFDADNSGDVIIQNANVNLIKI